MSTLIHACWSPHCQNALACLRIFSDCKKLGVQAKFETSLIPIILFQILSLDILVTADNKLGFRKPKSNSGI
jgi:hypothetical protein